MGFFPNIALPQSGHAVIEVSSHARGVENSDGEAPESFDQLLDAAVNTALHGDPQSKDVDLDVVVPSVLLGNTVHDEGVLVAFPQPFVGQRVEGSPFVEAGDLLQDMAVQNTRAEVDRVDATPFASQLAPLDEADDSLLRVQPAVTVPSTEKAPAIVTPVSQALAPTRVAPEVKGAGNVQSQFALPENADTLEKQAMPANPSSSDAAQKMTTAIHVATEGHRVDVAKSDLALSTVAQKMTTAIHVATAGHVVDVVKGESALSPVAQKMTPDVNVTTAGQAVDVPKGERVLSTSLAGSHDKSDGHPHPQGKPVVNTNPQTGFVVNADSSEAESLLPVEVSVVTREVKVVEPDMLQQPTRIDPQKTLGMTPVENVQDSRGVSHAQRGPIEPTTTMAEGIQRVEQATRISQLTNQQSIRLELNPPELGRVVVNLNVHDQRVTTAMITDQPFVRDILMANQHRLESSLQDQGLRMQDFSVDLGRRGMPQGQDASQDGGTGTRGRMSDDAAEDTPPEPREEHRTELTELNVFA